MAKRTQLSITMVRDDFPLTKEGPHHPALAIDININNVPSKEFLYNGPIKNIILDVQILH